LLAVLTQFGRVVMTIIQNETDVCGNFPQQIGSRFAVTLIGVSRASMGNQTTATTETRCSFQPETKALPAEFGEIGLWDQSRYEKAPLSRDISVAKPLLRLATRNSR